MSPQARTEYLRRKSRAALQSAGAEGADDVERSESSLEHLNLFPLEEASEKTGNEEYLREKKEEKVTELFLLFFFTVHSLDLNPCGITHDQTEILDKLANTIFSKVVVYNIFLIKICLFALSIMFPPRLFVGISSSLV